MTRSDPTTPATPAFLALDARVPGALRDLLNEADGSVKHNFLTGATVCAQRAIQTLLVIEKAEGADVQSRVRALAEKHPGVPPMLSNVLLQFGDVTSRDGARLSAAALNVLVVTLKALLYEIYVLGPERTERLEYVRPVLESIERKKPAPPAAERAS